MSCTSGGIRTHTSRILHVHVHVQCRCDALPTELPRHFSWLSSNHSYKSIRQSKVHCISTCTFVSQRVHLYLNMYICITIVSCTCVYLTCSRRDRYFSLYSFLSLRTLATSSLVSLRPSPLAFSYTITCTLYMYM